MKYCTLLSSPFPNTAEGEMMSDIQIKMLAHLEAQIRLTNYEIQAFRTRENWDVEPFQHFLGLYWKS